jgi:single-strand DNA-binding protein
MASYNRVILVGNLTRDVELKYTQSGLAVTEVTLAVNDRRKTQTGEWVEETTFVDVTLWGRTAEVASEYLGKGSPLLIEGRLKLDQWETEGQKRSRLRVVGERMQMLGAKGGKSGPPAANRPPAPMYDESEYSPPPSQREDTGGANGGSGGAPAGPPQDDIPF